MQTLYFCPVLYFFIVFYTTNFNETVKSGLTRQTNDDLGTG